MEKDNNKSDQKHSHSESESHQHANAHNKKRDSDNSEHKHEEKDHQHHDHTEHHQMMIKDFKLRFWISLIITLPILHSRLWFKIYWDLNFRYLEKQTSTFFLDFPLLYSSMVVGLSSRDLLMS